MNATDRRVNRSSYKCEALRLQLEACRQRAGLDAMVLADDQGLCLAAVGDMGTCEELAARSAVMGQRTRQFHGVMLAGRGGAWEVDMRRFDVAGTELYVTAIGGDGGERAAQVTHSMGGISRILCA